MCVHSIAAESRSCLSGILLLGLSLVLLPGVWAAADNLASPPRPVVWTLDSTASIGGRQATVLGAPRFVDSGVGPAACFNGKDDGLIFPVNPIAGWAQFTIEVLFRPDADGPEAQRFMHLQDDRESRAMIEIRVTPEGQWCLDTYLLSGKNNLPLMDRAKLHPAGRWYWVALVYDGKKEAHFVDGAREMEGEVAFAAMTKGQTALGVRLNRVYWFKGCIREVRFSPTALGSQQLQRPSKSE
jgi:Concanavalin A-like lectin/glucanases superfamily